MAAAHPDQINMASYSARDVQILHIHQMLSDIGSVKVVFQL